MRVLMMDGAVDAIRRPASPLSSIPLLVVTNPEPSQGGGARHQSRFLPHRADLPGGFRALCCAM
jgi:hypothetical protein